MSLIIDQTDLLSKKKMMIFQLTLSIKVKSNRLLRLVFFLSWINFYKIVIFKVVNFLFSFKHSLLFFFFFKFSLLLGTFCVKYVMTSLSELLKNKLRISDACHKMCKVYQVYIPMRLTINKLKMNFVKSIQGKGGGGASKVSITCIFKNSEALLMIFCIIFLLMKLYELILGALVSYCYIQTDIFKWFQIL